MKCWVPLLVCLSLAGCGSADETGAPEGDVTPSEAALIASDAPLEIAITQFPGGYQGQWAAVASQCADENNEQNLSLQGKLVKFHDSIGTMTEGKRETSREMEATFEIVSEGEKWNKTIGFQLSKDGKRLTRTDMDGGAAYEYIKCPPLMAG